VSQILDIQKERNERKEIVVSLLEQIGKLNIKELKEKIQIMNSILLDLYYYYQRCSKCFYMYIYSSTGEKPTVCITTKSHIEVRCYNESDVQKIIETFFNDLSAETKLWKVLRDAFSDFVEDIISIISKHEENDP